MKNILVIPPFSSPHDVLQSLCLLRKPSNISMKVSGPAMETAWSALLISGLT